MNTSLAEHALKRVLDYLAACGCDINDDVVSRALQLVSQGMAQQQGSGPINSELFAWCLQELPQWFQLPALEPVVPQIQPALQRASIGYR